MLLLFTLVTTLTGVSALTANEDPNWTKIHEGGRCAIRDQCGKKSFFGKELPCPDNNLARDPEPSLRQKLVSLCGDKWSQGPVCCEDSQLEALSSNLKIVESIISSCPACQENFFNLFCSFTCSPNQSLFLNVTNIQKGSAGRPVVTEIDYLLSTDYGKKFYDSCKDVKYGAAGTNAMSFIGGGAKNYIDFLAFLGDEKLLGSPFQLNFPPPKGREVDGMLAMHDKPKSCNGRDERFRCACVDCPDVCPELPKLETRSRCQIGTLSCWSFSAIIVYAAVFFFLVAWRLFQMDRDNSLFRKSERFMLLQDSMASDDEDEEEEMRQAIKCAEPPQTRYFINTICDAGFSNLGRTCARFPAITIFLSFAIVGFLSLGWINFAIETNPTRLWVEPQSLAAEEKAFFDSNFGPFFRAQQAFLVKENSWSDQSPLLTYDTLSWWFDVEDRISKLESKNGGFTLDDVCFKPSGDACAVQSIKGYFDSGEKPFTPSKWQKSLETCTNSPILCRPNFGQPLSPNLVLGGWEPGRSILSSEAIIVTWVVNDHAEGSREELRAKDWEETLKNFFLEVQIEAQERGLRLSFSTEISLEQELNKSTNTDAKIVALSYVVMFIYVAFALGSTGTGLWSLIRNPGQFIINSKFSLAVAGIAIVLLSVSASVGLFSAMNIKVTLIIAEVIPFLVLAVGVDNIFLIVHEFDRVNISHPDSKIEDRIARALGRMGPSILLSASTETLAFALGAFVGMPAVRNFAIYAAGAVLINAILQVTMFVSVLSLNQLRMENGRADCLPCVIVETPESSAANGSSRLSVTSVESFLREFNAKTYASFLLERNVKFTVLLAFTGLFAAGLALIPQVSLGLDQRIAIPSDSYLIPYFNDLYEYFDAGPPVYFVTRELNITQRNHQQQLCGRFSTCNSYSIANVLEQERKRSQLSYIAEPAASWIDDYMGWLNPGLEKCCIENGEVCMEGRDPPWNVALHGLPQGQEFIHYLEKWIQASSNMDCSLGGKAAYSNALVIDPENFTIPASHFRTSHSPLRSQQDFIDAYASARRIADTINEHNGIKVFPYSKFYIFFDQYASIIRLTTTLVGSALAVILVLSTTLLGSVKTGLAVTLTVTMIVGDIVGTMYLAGVSLNAISLVNLVICVGIGVEFCAHIARAFMFPSRYLMEQASGYGIPAEDARAWAALVNVGGSVFNGITITKFLGVSVLAFTKSKIFEIYYFRIWLALVLVAATHALVFLPVVLSFIGGCGYADPEADGGLEEDLASRRYGGSLIPDDEDSDEEEAY
ncbi:MAG: hypothetical protein M1829_006036 [Trizodia sp. TS-e1964]|nr:MAG: hypothetical protein M1829_006036 [Trizodia sp. TS-e1964]